MSYPVCMQIGHLGIPLCDIEIPISSSTHIGWIYPQKCFLSPKISGLLFWFLGSFPFFVQQPARQLCQNLCGIVSRKMWTDPTPWTSIFPRSHCHLNIPEKCGQIQLLNILFASYSSSFCHLTSLFWFIIFLYKIYMQILLVQGVFLTGPAQKVSDYM